MTAEARPEIWAFLGDSLTEGIGSKRVSYVSELVGLMRNTRTRPVHGVRLRDLDLSGNRDLSHFNFAGHFDRDPTKPGAPLWIINLGAEGTTIEHEARRVDFVAALRAVRIFVLRGPLETILRPLALVTGDWPAWVPRAWRGSAPMDPRCFFSASRWRYSKQRLIDEAKQAVRLRLLRRGGAPLLTCATFLSCYEWALDAMRAGGATVTVLSLPPVSEATFPGTSTLVKSRNCALRDICAVRGIDFLDWHDALSPLADQHFCRDGFHPNDEGARIMARLLLEHLGRDCRPLGIKGVHAA